MRSLTLASILSLASPAWAEDPTVDFLEQTGVVWLAAELPLPVQEGLVFSMVPYVQFADGQVESGFLTGTPNFAAASCVDMLQCADMTQQAPIFAGPYSVEGNIIQSSGRVLDEWVLEREDLNLIAVSSDAFYGGRAVMERDGDRLIQIRPEGPRSYIALPEDMRFAPVNLPFYTGESMAMTYECTVQVVADLVATPEAERHPRQHQLASLLRIAEAQLSRDNARRLLQPFWLTEDLSDDDQRQVDQLRAEMGVASMFRLVVSNLEADIADDETRRTVTEFVSSIQDIAPDAKAVQTLLDRLYPDMLLAAPLFAELTAPNASGQAGLRSVLCGG